jgi:transposase
MAKPLVTDEFWALVEPLLPQPKHNPKGGRPPVDNRMALTGILFVLMTGIPWRMIPTELGFCSGMTCWRRLRDWQEAGVWQELHAICLDKLAIANKIDWDRACADSSSVPAPLAKKRANKQLGHLRRIAENRARSATLW